MRPLHHWISGLEPIFRPLTSVPFIIEFVNPVTWEDVVDVVAGGGVRVSR